ncbi:MAG: hypothetical protein FWD15_00455 [Alphaproteobacteria bacterium]|nr:hypothetical protein [Alphaproteobacteria bacterium]
MSIDFITVILQAINFLISLWVLRRWVFTPVMKNMSERKRRLERELVAAELARGELENERKNFDMERERMEAELAREREDGMAEIARIREEETLAFKSDIESRQAAFERLLKSERAKFLGRLEAAAGEDLAATLRGAVEFITSRPMEEVICLRLVEMLKTGKMEGLAQLRKFYAAERSVLVKAPFIIAADMRREIAAAFDVALKEKAKVKFERVLQMPIGILISCGDLELSFSIENFIEEFIARVKND